MQITCQACQGKFRIADEKIPENKSVNISCPKCKKKIRVNGRMSEQKNEMNAVSTGELPFDVLGDEQTAILCCNQDKAGQAVQKSLAETGFKTVFVDNSADAIKMSRFHPFDVAVIDENFDPEIETSKHIFNHLQLLPMSSRRKLFVAYITDKYRTNEHMGAYCQSVNLIVNRKQIPEFKTVFGQAIKENDTFYAVYNETMKKYA